MRLNNLRFPGDEGRYDLWIENGKIAAIQPSQSADPITTNTLSTAPLAPSGELSLDLYGALAIPGLINSHDHLDFNLFPPLGKGGYTNYSAWGKDIHTQNQAEISAVIKIPLALRTQWGLYKNLLSGVTTVVNHGERLVIDGAGALISVLQNAHSLHSVAFEKNWKWKVNRPRAAKP